jgi:hypothetical protein
MPSILSAFTRASDIPPQVISTLERHGHAANVILPQIEKSRQSEPSGSQLWIVHQSDRDIEYVLAVTEGQMGPYPAFIFTTKRARDLTGPLFDSQMEELAQELHGRVNPRRIYSVFAVQPICAKFCDIWSKLTGIPIEDGPYYDSILSYCTPQTLRHDNQRPALHDFEMRPATPGDLEMVAVMCQGFSEESVSHLNFVLPNIESCSLTIVSFCARSASSSRRGQLLDKRWTCLGLHGAR